MSVRPPKALWRPSAPVDPLTASLDHEVRAEKAGTLGRLMQRLDKKLAAVAALDDRPDCADDDRQRVLDEAGEALWHVVIQRELCGFGRTAQFLKDMRVPRAVQLRMGIRRGG